MISVIHKSQKAKAKRGDDDNTLVPSSIVFLCVISQVASLGTVGNLLSDMWWGPQK